MGLIEVRNANKVTTKWFEFGRKRLELFSPE